MQNSIKLSDNLSLSPIVAGCMRIADAKIPPADILRFVEGCLDMGVDSFDHAPVYGGYTVEEIFGDAVLRLQPGLRNKMKLISKTGIVLPGKDNNKSIYYKATRDWIIPEVERSLSKLGTDRLDLLLVHRFDPLADPAELGSILDELVQSGKTLNIGVSNYTIAAFETLQANMQAKLVTNQVEISAKTPDILFNGIGDNALRSGMPLMAWSPLGGGSLFTGDDEQSRRLRKTVNAVAETHGAQADTILYAWLLRLPQTVLPITGTVNLNRIRSAVASLNVVLSHDEWYAILAASRGFEVP